MESYKYIIIIGASFSGLFLICIIFRACLLHFKVYDKKNSIKPLNIDTNTNHYQSENVI